MLKIPKSYLAAALVAVALGAAPAMALAEDPLNEMNVIRPAVKLEAPAFTLMDTGGAQRSLDEYRGSVILLNFWATFCKPCREEMPAMERLWKGFEDRGLVVIAIATDRGRRSMKTVKSFCNTHSVTFPVLLDPSGDVRRAYEVVVLPTSYIIGRDGKFIGKVLGPRKWDGVESRRFFEGLLR